MIYISQISGFFFSLISVFVFYEELASFAALFQGVAVSAVLSPVFFRGRDFYYIRAEKAYLQLGFWDVVFFWVLFLLAFYNIYIFVLVVFQVIKRASVINSIRKGQLLKQQVYEGVILPFMILLIVSEVCSVFFIFFIFILYFIVFEIGFFYKKISFDFLDFSIFINDGFNMYSTVIRQFIMQLPTLLTTSFYVDFLPLARVYQSIYSFYNSSIVLVINHCRLVFLDLGKKLKINSVLEIWFRGFKCKGLMLIFFFLGSVFSFLFVNDIVFLFSSLYFLKDVDWPIVLFFTLIVSFFPPYNIYINGAGMSEYNFYSSLWSGLLCLVMLLLAIFLDFYVKALFFIPFIFDFLLRIFSCYFAKFKVTYA